MDRSSLVHSALSLSVLSACLSGRVGRWGLSKAPIAVLSVCLSVNQPSGFTTAAKIMTKDLFTKIFV